MTPNLTEPCLELVSCPKLNKKVTHTQRQPERRDIHTTSSMTINVYVFILFRIQSHLNTKRHLPLLPTI